MPVPLEATLTGDFIEASRRAGSFREALHAALESLRWNTGAEAAFLLENSSGEYRLTAAVPEAEPFAIPARGLLASRLPWHASPLAISAGDLEVWRRWAAASKPGHCGEIAALQAAGVRLAVSLRTARDQAGILLLAAPAGREGFDAAERRAVGGCAELVALMLENARLTGRVLDQEILRRDIVLAAEVQQRLLPRQTLETPAAWVAAVNLPARSVGGDYYDFFDRNGAGTGIALADVAGKGVAAALIMSVVQASLRVIAADQGLPLPQLVARMNGFLHRATGASSYATFFFAQIHERERALRYVNAGHNPPYLLRAATGRIEELSAGGTIIGMFPGAGYEEAVVALCPGDVLLAFTDGVTEALNPAGEEFGESRLQQLLRELRHLPAEEMAARLTRGLKEWMGEASQYDDLTFVLVKMK